MSRTQVIAAVAAVVVIGGGIAIGLSLGGGSSKSTANTPPSVVTTAPVHVAPLPAGSAAVADALRHGQLNVVVDDPPSGAFGEQNHLIAQGAQVAAEELDAAGGLPGHVHVNLVQQTLDGLSPSALQQRLAAQGSGVLILPCDTDSQLSLAAAGARYGTLMLAACNYEPAAAQHYPTYWPVGSAANEEVAELATYMSTAGFPRVFVVGATGTHYVEALTSDFKQAVQSKHIRVAGSASVGMNTQDFTSLAQEIKSAGPKLTAVFTALPPPAVNRLAAALQAQGVGATLFGTSVMDGRFTLTNGSAGLENAVFASYGFPRENSAAQQFAGDYAKQFGKAPLGSFPGLGYETVRLLEEASKQARSANPSAIQQALARGLTLHGIALANRRYVAGSDHNPVSEVGVEKIAGRNFEPLLAGSPDGAPPGA